MEAFERIYFDLSKQPGKCRIAETGIGWKPSGGGETFTLDSSNFTAAQWSRAAKGYELRVLTRNKGIIQLDGFDQEVSFAGLLSHTLMLTSHRTLIAQQRLSS